MVSTETRKTKSFFILQIILSLFGFIEPFYGINLCFCCCAAAVKSAQLQSAKWLRTLRGWKGR